MMITYKSRFLTRGEVWFENEPHKTHGRVDWLFHHQRSRPKTGARSKPFNTYLIDLTQSRDQLEANLNKDTAYKIRRARERDKITCECCDLRNEVVMSQFEQMYNSFAVSKGLAPLVRPRFESLAAAGLLDLSVAKDSKGNALLYHANYRDSRRAAGMELPSIYRTLSDSAARNLIGRANRYLTWTEILRYKDQGLKYFDFGGWYSGTDPAKLRINDFKRGFGGRVVPEYNCEQILTLKGWVVLTAAALWRRSRNSMARPNGRRAPTTPAQSEVQSPIPDSLPAGLRS